MGASLLSGISSAESIICADMDIFYLFSVKDQFHYFKWRLKDNFFYTTYQFRFLILPVLTASSGYPIDNSPKSTSWLPYNKITDRTSLSKAKQCPLADRAKAPHSYFGCSMNLWIVLNTEAIVIAPMALRHNIYETVIAISLTSHIHTKVACYSSHPVGCLFEVKSPVFVSHTLQDIDGF